MNRQSCLYLLILSILLMSCSPPTSAVSPDGSPESPLSTSEKATTSQGQQLPISAHATFAGQVIQLEVARTPRQQAMGLMFRPALPDDRGMLFPFDPPQPVGFWMKNVPVPLDMVFVRDGVVQAIADNVPPCKKEPCPTYGPKVPIDHVIELRGGRAAELGLKLGDRLEIKFLPSEN